MYVRVFVCFFAGCKNLYCIFGFGFELNTRHAKQMPLALFILMNDIPNFMRSPRGVIDVTLFER